MKSSSSLLVYRLGILFSLILNICLLKILNNYNLTQVVTIKGDFLNTSILSNDDFIRNCVSNKVIGRVDHNVVKTNEAAASNGVKENATVRKESFQGVFDKNLWHNEKGDFAHSGEGSTLSYTNELFSNLNIIVNAIKKEKGEDYVVKILDVPCGDLQWMPRFLDMRKGDVNYTGMDIVPAVISHHKEKFKNQKWTFILQDIVETDKLSAYDIIISRQFMQHLLSVEVLKVLKLFSQSGSSYLFTTTFPTVGGNRELNPGEPGRYRPLNIELPPISLTNPLCYGLDGPRHRNHFMALWRLPLKYISDCKSSQSTGEGFACSKTTFYRGFF